MEVGLDAVSYIIGYTKGVADGTTNVVLEGGITCTDPNSDGNVVITEA